MNAVDKLRQHELLYRKWRRHLSVEQRDMLGLLIDQIAGIGRASRALSYRDLIHNEHAPARYSERQLRRIMVEGLEAAGAIRVERPAGGKMVITLTLESEPRSDGAQPQTPDTHDRGRPEPRTPMTGVPRTPASGHLTDYHQQTTNKRTDHEESSPAEPSRRAGVVALVSDAREAEKAQPSGSAPPISTRPARRDHRRPLSERAYAVALPVMRARWDAAHAAAEWRPVPGYVAPAWIDRERGQLAKMLVRLAGDVSKTCAFLEWCVENWRSLHKHEFGRGCPGFPDIHTIAKHFVRLHAAWQYGAERAWIESLPREERELTRLLGQGLSRDEALVKIAETRVLAKHRDEFAAAERRANTATRVAVASERAVELARRRAGMQRPPVRTRTRPTILIKDTSPEEIKRVLDEQMASFTPPDWDHDPYADPAAG